MKSIMFVCTGNICRSAAAHMYMQNKVKQIGRENEFLISSCGTNAINGQSASQNTIITMNELGIDANMHRAKYIEDTNIKDYDLILCMTNQQKSDVLMMYKVLKDKVYTLKEYVDFKSNYIDIDDPWGYDIDVYRFTNREIIKNIDKLLEMI